MIGSGSTVSCSAELSDADERLWSWAWPKSTQLSEPVLPRAPGRFTAPSPNVPWARLAPTVALDM